MPARPTVMWFRQDLRLADNPALADAAAAGPVVPLYILDEAAPPRPMGAASRWWLDRSLRALDHDLNAKGSRLVLRRGDSLAALLQLSEDVGAVRVVCNRLYDQASIARDEDIRLALETRGLEFSTFNASLLNEPWEVLTGGAGYRVFTAYWKAARQRVDPASISAPARLDGPPGRQASDDLKSWCLHPTRPDWSTGFNDWHPGEAGAWERLSAFLQNGARNYSSGRNVMAEAGVSALSPHLHFGEIGPRQVWCAVADAAEHGHVPHGEAEAYQRELGWREFNYGLLFHNPEMLERPLNARFEALKWRDDENAFKAWTRGETGFPVVDAAMRQLWTTGWMHNRARLIAASFLVKDLLIDWRRGEAWFWDTLVDADLANNVANWQWIAGVGADAAPFFRVFNPTLQAEKFDSRGDYVRRWVPELSGVATRALRDPDLAKTDGLDYPSPIVDHSQARDRALAAYASLKQ